MKALCALALGGLALALTGPASATTCSNANFKKLQFDSSDTGAVLWQTPRADSPLDTNKARLMLHVLLNDGAGLPQPWDIAAVYSNCSGIEGQTLPQVKNLSFDFMNETGQPVHIGAGSPRFSTGIDTDGNGAADFYTFMAASYCQAVLPEDTTWSRADFTGRVLAGCALQAQAETFTSDGSKSAWTLFAEAHPTWKVTEAFLILDEDGTAFIDRVAIQNKMYVAPGSGSAAIKSCSTEASC